MRAEGRRLLASDSRVRHASHVRLIRSIWALITLALGGTVACASLPRAQSPERPVVDGDWWQIADEDFDAGQYSNRPAPGEQARDEHQEVGDFTIFQASDGTWQLISAVRQMRFRGSRHLLFRWQSRSLTAPHWTPQGVFWTTDAKPDLYAPGGIYAPHCIRVAGTYYLFHSTADKAVVLTSRDGKRFVPIPSVSGEPALFRLREGGRDLMVVDNRPRDGRWYVFYAGMDRLRPELAPRNFHDVFARTAPHPLGPYSSSRAVGLGTPNRPAASPHAAADFVNAESPFVVYRNGYYYKFEQNFVVASRNIWEFDHQPIVGRLYPDFDYPSQWWPALAPEVVEFDGRYYVAMFRNHKDRPLSQGGIFMARLKWIRGT